MLFSFLFFTLKHNYRAYGHLAVSIARNVPFAGALASLIFNSLSWNDKVNAGAKTAECRASPVLTESDS